MTYIDLMELLLSNEVYNNIKQKENEIFRLIPELKKCNGFNQNSKWHIYDVYEHILHVVSNVQNDKCLRLTALFHDVGKPFTYTEDEKGIGHFYNHWNISVEIFKKYENLFELSNEDILLIKNLIFYHDINIDKLTLGEKSKLLKEIGYENIWMLFDLKRSDLLAQSSEFHYLINDINNQEYIMKKMTKQKHRSML